MLDTTCARPNFTGKLLERVLETMNMCLNTPLNFYTYISATNGIKSCLDLCFSSPNLAALVKMRILADVGSNPSPVVITLELCPKIVEKLYT